MSDIAHTRILVAIETDATRYHGEHASRPRLQARGHREAFRRPCQNQEALARARTPLARCMRATP